MFHPGWAAAAGRGPADLREGGVLVPSGGGRARVRALEGRPRLVPAVRHAGDHAGAGREQKAQRHSNRPEKFQFHQHHHFS